VLFVEYLDASVDNSKSIMLGGMFWQSIYGQYTQFGYSGV